MKGFSVVRQLSSVSSSPADLLCCQAAAKCCSFEIWRRKQACVKSVSHPRRMTKVRICQNFHWGPLVFSKKKVVTSAVSPPGHDRFSWLWEAVWGEVLHFLSASTWQSSQHVILIYGQRWIRAGKAASERKLCWYLLICGRCRCTDSLEDCPNSIQEQNEHGLSSRSRCWGSGGSGALDIKPWNMPMPVTAMRVSADKSELL